MKKIAAICAMGAFLMAGASFAAHSTQGLTSAQKQAATAAVDQLPPLEMRAIGSIAGPKCYQSCTNSLNDGSDSNFTKGYQKVCMAIYPKQSDNCALNGANNAKGCTILCDMLDH